MQKKQDRVWTFVLSIYLLCFALRIWEYVLLHTDQTVWGEALVHKLLGIGVLYAAARYSGLGLRQIGFAPSGAARNLSLGLGLGLLAFVPAYLAEIALLAAQGNFTGVGLFVSAYTVDGTAAAQTGLVFFLLCIAGNLINVLMEEGLFRGLFQKVLETRYPFWASAALASGLFGLWHIMAPLRSYWDGSMGSAAFWANALLLVGTSALIGFKFALLTRITGSLYAAMGDHFVNNTIVNLLHVLSYSGADELQTVRIALAQSLSFLLVLIWYKNKRGL